MQFDIDNYLINYTKKLDEEPSRLIGREKELERLIHILLRKTKNNPVVVGVAGIGKTALYLPPEKATYTSLFQYENHSETFASVRWYLSSRLSA